MLLCNTDCYILKLMKNESIIDFGGRNATGGAEHNKTIGFDAANEIITDAVAKGLRMLI